MPSEPNQDNVNLPQQTVDRRQKGWGPIAHRHGHTEKGTVLYPGKPIYKAPPRPHVLVTGNTTYAAYSAEELLEFLREP